MNLLTLSSPGVFQLCLWPLTAPGYLGEGCHASHQPSDASTPWTAQKKMCWPLQISGTQRAKSVSAACIRRTIIKHTPVFLWVCIVPVLNVHDAKETRWNVDHAERNSRWTMQRKVLEHVLERGWGKVKTNEKSAQRDANTACWL